MSIRSARDSDRTVRAHAGARAVGVRRRRSHLDHRKVRGLALVAPLVILNIVVILGPTLAAVGYAFTDWDGIGSPTWVGLENFRRLAADDEFHGALLHNLQWMVIFLVVPIAMGLLGAFMLSRITRFEGLFRALYFIPYMLASAVNAAIWQNLLDADAGIGAQLAEIGVPWLEGVSVLGDTDLALPAVAFIDNWHWWGFVCVVFLAAMGSVDTQLYEAARMDGASMWREFWHVTLPGLRPTLVFICLMSVIWSFLVFDYVYLVTQGGPAGATETVATLLYRTAFSTGEAGYATAMGLTLGVVSFLVTGVYLLVRRSGWEA